MALKEVKNLSISFGGLRAVDGFNLKIEKGMLYGLIGPNGAGKTTVFNLLTGVYKPTTGTFSLDGVKLKGKNPVESSKAGKARTFQNIRLFKKLSVLDNVKGIGDVKKKELLKTFGSVENISNASVEELMGIKGITKKLAENIKENLKKE